MLENAPAVGHCGPGSHEIPWGRLGGTICAPDVPGAGLPWDLPTALSAIGCVTFLTLILGWLIVAEIGDRKIRRAVR
jgi:hypothetical protein